MNDLDKILEKISTFNINANTDVDIQSIIESYMMFNAATEVGITLVVMVGLVTVAALVYRGWMKTVEAATDSESVKKMKEVLASFDNYRKFEELNEGIQEIREYMPRNKNKRKIE